MRVEAGSNGFAGSRLLLVTLALLAGQGLGDAGLPALASVPLLAAALLGLARRRSAALRLAVAAAGLALGHLQMERVRAPQLDAGHIAHHAGASVELEGRIADRPRRSADRTRFTVAVEQIGRGAARAPAHGRVLVTVRAAAQPWQRGDRVRARLRLRRPRNFGNPGEFDYEAYLARRGVYVTAFAAGDRSWERGVPPDRIGWAFFDAWRQAVVSVLDSSASGDTRRILGALVAGESDLPAALRERYARTGTSHILSISGLHVGLVAGAGYAAARWLLARSEWLLLCANVPKLAVGFASLPVLFYAGLAGASTPTVRSVLMGLLAALATLVNRPRSWLASICASALAINLVAPGAFLDISFQLSFAAVVSIVLGMRRVSAAWSAWEEEHLVRLRGRGWPVLRWAVLYLGTTFCATAGTVPLTAWHFNLISLSTFVANPLAVPLLGGVPVGLGLLAAVLTPLSDRLAGVLFTVAAAFVWAGDRLIALLAELPGGSLRVITPSALELICVYGALLALCWSDARRRRLLAICLAVLAIDAAVAGVRRFARTTLRVTILSVGHGDSAVLEFPGSEVMVIDGGGLSPGFDTGERLIAPYLGRRRIAQVDYLVLSHADYDHYGGLGFLARELRPKEIWWNGAGGAGAELIRFTESVAASGARPVVVRRGFRRSIGGVGVLALAPEGDEQGDNARSLVLRLRFGETTLLFPGDLEGAGEARLVQKLRPVLPSRVLKVPHHGSRTSSTAQFLDAVAPEIAVISTGYENRFGLPHPQVVRNYEQRGIHLLRTDLHGAVVFEIDAGGRLRTATRRISRPSPPDPRSGGGGEPAGQG